MSTALWSAGAVWVVFVGLIPLGQKVSGEIYFRTDAILPALYLLALALAIVIGRAGGRDGDGWLRQLLVALLGAAVVSVGICLLQWAGVSDLWIADLRYGARPFGNIAQPNHLASLLGWAVVAVWYLFETRRITGLGAFLLMIWLFLGLAMTQSRTAWVFSAGLVGWWWWGRGRAGLRTRYVHVVAAAVLLVAETWLWYRLNEWLLIAQESPWAERMEAGPRYALWQGLAAAVAQSPWWGWGWNQVVLGEYAVAINQNVGGRMLEYSHNVVLDLMLWVGLPLTCLILVAVGYWVWRQIRNCRTPEQWSVLGVLWVICIHAMTEYPHAYLYFLLPAGMFVGVLEAAGNSPALMRGYKFTWALLAGLLIMLGLICQEYLAVEETERSVRMSLARIGNAPDAPISSPPVQILDSAVAYQQFRLRTAHAGMSDAEFDQLRKVAQRHPFPPALLRYALAAGLNQRPEEARGALVALCHMHPQPRCDEARQSWQFAQSRYPELARIPAP